jgi:hypothetical protein
MMIDEDCMLIKYILVNMVCLWLVIVVICIGSTVSEFYSNDGLKHDSCITDKVNDDG